MAALLSQQISCVDECGRFQSFSNSAKQAWQVERKGSMGLLTTRHLGDGLLPGGQALTGAPGPHLFCSPPPSHFYHLFRSSAAVLPSVQGFFNLF